MTQPEAEPPVEISQEPLIVEHGGHLLVPNPSFYNTLGLTATALFALSGGLEIEGAEHLPKPNQAGMIAATHDRMIGVLAQCESARRQGIHTHNMAKDKFWEKRPIGKILEAGGAFPVDRDVDFSQQPKVLSHIDSVVQRHGVLKMYIEGSRKNHAPGHIKRRTLKKGAGFIAVKWGLPITPASSTDTFTFNNIVYGPQIPVQKVNFNLANLQDLIEVSHVYVKPLLDEVYESLHDAQNTAHAKRIDAIANHPYLPKRVKQRLFLEH